MFELNENHRKYFYILFLIINVLILQSNGILLKLGRYHRTVGIPSDYFGVMGPMFVHSIQPSLEKKDMWDDDMQDAWLSLFGHMTRVMTYGHTYAHLHNAENAEVRPRSKTLLS